MTRLLSILILCFFSLILVWGCSNSQTASPFGSRVKAVGKANQVVVIMDDKHWNGPLGDTLRFYYMAPYLLLPQPEPIFDLRHHSPSAIQQKTVRKELRTYMVIGDLNDKESPTAKMIREDLGEEMLRKAQDLKEGGFSVGKNKWADNQLLVYQYDFNEDQLIETIKKNFETARSRINKFDAKQIYANAYQAGEDKALETQILENFGALIRIPKNYTVSIQDSTFIWLRKETHKHSNNIMIHVRPYTSADQVTKESLIAMRNSLGRKYISTPVPGSYMRVNDVDLPVFVSSTNVNGSFALEAKGIWDMVNDFMGGAFVSYLIPNPSNGTLLFLDAFLYSPGELHKRDYIQQIEYILKTTELEVVEDAADEEVVE